MRLVRRSSREFVERVFVCAVGVMTTGCLAPTEATLSISSDTCHDDAAYHATNIMVVSSQTMAASNGATIVPAASTQSCSADGGIGSLVIVPGANGNGPIVVTVAMGVGINPNYCGVTDAGTHCIIETRELTLVDNTPFTLPIEMLKVCEGVYCPPGQTCVGPDQCGSDKVSMTDCPVPHTGCLESFDSGAGHDGGARPPDGGADGTVHDAGHDSAVDATMHPKDGGNDGPKENGDAGKDAGNGPIACKGQSLDAGCLEQLQGNQEYPWAIAEYAGRVYWTTECQDQGFPCTLDGSVWTTNASLVDAGESIAAHQSGPTAISVSDAGVFWTTRGGCTKTGNMFDCTGTVVREPLNGGAATTIAGSTTNGAGQESSPLGIVAVGSTVYWVDNGMLTDGGYVYANASGSVHRFTVQGDTPIVPGQQGPGGIAVDHTSVYWTNFGAPGTEGVGGTLLKSGLDGGTPMTLALNQDYIINVAVADASAYWLTWGYGIDSDGGKGTLETTSVSSPETPVALASNLRHGWNLAVDDHALYWADPIGGTILSTSRTAGGAVVTLVADLATPTNVFLDNGVLYWTNNGLCADAGTCSGSIMKLTLR